MLLSEGLFLTMSYTINSSPLLVKYDCCITNNNNNNNNNKHLYCAIYRKLIRGAGEEKKPKQRSLYKEKDQKSA